MKNIKNLSPIIIFLILIPIFSFAQGVELPDCGPLNDCGYEQLIKLVENIIDWIILVSIPVATGIFAWVGFKYMTTGVADQKAEAKAMLWKVFWGFVAILSSVLIVDTILKALT